MKQVEVQLTGLATIFRKKYEETNNPSRCRAIRNYLCWAGERWEEPQQYAEPEAESHQFCWQDRAGSERKHSIPVVAVTFLSSMSGNLGAAGWVGSQSQSLENIILGRSSSVLSVMSRWVSWYFLPLGGLDQAWHKVALSQYKVISPVSPSLSPWQTRELEHSLTGTDIFIQNKVSPDWPLGELEVCSLLCAC